MSTEALIDEAAREIEARLGELGVLLDANAPRTDREG